MYTDTRLMTEREWRRRNARASKRRSICWGAQCMMSAPRRPLTRDRAFQAFLILVSLTAALCMPILTPRTQRSGAYPELGEPQTEAVFAVRTVSAVSYSIPDGLACAPRTYTTEQLSRGKLFLLDEAHPLPAAAPAPNTLRISTHGKGMVPVSDLAIKSGRETINALVHLFNGMRARGAGALSVCRATLSTAEQRALQLEALSSYVHAMPLEGAVARVLSETDRPGSGELLQEYSVEIRLNGEASTRPLAQTEQGRILLQHAWRYGFIQRFPYGVGSLAYRFRYVGVAHATAMTYLDLSFEKYLDLLHQKGVIAVRENDDLRYLILCRPMSETHVEFSLPQGAVCEASLDNTGYAVVACTLGHIGMEEANP
ncbi:MAG: hypothetical protein RSC98_03700 [Clostridia bacterium]